MARKNAIINAVMGEHVALPGCPQIVVTRGWLYTWLRDSLGYDPKAKGYASMDYLAFGRREVSDDLTDLTDPNVARLLAFMVHTETGA